MAMVLYGLIISHKDAMMNKMFYSVMLLLLSMISVPAYAWPGCFHDTTSDENILYIVRHDIYGEELQGTAFITSDHKILTARHIITGNVKYISVFWSNGVMLGQASVEKGMDKNDNKGMEYLKNDYAVLDMDFAGDRQKKKFDEAHGFNLKSDGQIYRFQVDGKLGIASGASGSPVIDDKNNVIGVLSAGTETDDEIYPNDFNLPKNPANKVDDFTPFPTMNIAYSAPIPGTVDPAEHLETGSGLKIIGYPNGYCVAYKAHVENMAQKVTLGNI